jgi:precorrin-2/cobalt-factor-2 C20-methyltransferase
MQLTIVGLGPGEPELVTVRGVRAIEAADVIFVPRSRSDEESRALRIAQPWVHSERQRVEVLPLPMTRDPDVLVPAWRTTAERIASSMAALAAARSPTPVQGAYLLLGDPLLYGSYIYIQRELMQNAPHIDLRVVPGVTSFAAAAAVAQLPLSTGDERVAIVPASQAVQSAHLQRLCNDFETVILMKVGHVLPQVLIALETVGLLDRALYAEHVGMPDEQIVRDVSSLRGQRRPYLSLLIIRQGEG